ncbi:MAG: RNA 3'-terminal phosphate cyclase [Byssovorax sp.]
MDDPAPATVMAGAGRLISRESVMLIIDGSAGEGGGQILRTSLALSLATHTPVRITGIRKGRQRPGLMRQHLTAVRACAKIGNAEIVGDEVGSTQITFTPGEVTPGDYTFAIGTAGSTTLVLQAVLPALLCAKARSTIALVGGTDNPMAPTFEFLARAYLPLVRRMGPVVTPEIEARGFYPAGGGRFRVTVDPSPTLSRLDLLERGALLRKSVVATVANLPGAIARRELEAANELLGWDPSCLRIEALKGAPGPGNVVSIVIESEHVTEVVSSFGEKGRASEIVGAAAAREALAYLESGVPVGEHLADQLLLPMALAGGGSFRTTAPSSHTATHLRLLEQILGVRSRVEALADGAWLIEVGR